MPASEQIWRNPKMMHRVFAASCVVLLVATVWMFVQDYAREWKGYQKTARRIEIQNNIWALEQFNSDEVLLAHDRLAQDLFLRQTEPVDAAILDEFKQLVESESPEFDFTKIDRLNGELKDLSATAQQKQEDAEKAWADAKQKQGAANEAALSESEDADALADDAVAKRIAAREADQVANEAGIEARAKRTELIAELNAVVTEARFAEDRFLDKRKELSGFLDEAKANLGLAVRDDKPQELLDQLQANVDEKKASVDEVSNAYDEAAKYRRDLLALVKRMTEAEDDATKKLEENRADIERLKQANIDQRSTYFVGSFPFLGKKWLELPILDAFNSPLQIENLWDNDNRIDFNFQKVRRYDRCTTCHQAMEKSLPGTADKPAYVDEQMLEFVLTTPPESEVEAIKEAVDVRIERLLEQGELESADVDAKRIELLLEAVYGIRLARDGEYLLSSEDVTISFVRSFTRESGTSEAGKDVLPISSLAAEAHLAGDENKHEKVEGMTLRMQAMFTPKPASQRELAIQPGLRVGDVLVEINDDYVTDRQVGTNLLLGVEEWGKPLRVQVRRGLPNPYSSHPRLDLFIGSLSPHKLSDFACTICHEGQGSATDFKWASHTPNSVKQLENWEREHGWFDNHHWIFPMYAKRFAEATCLKCHHDVTSLEPSTRFPEPPAPSVTRGHDLIRKYGCYGCHEINGYDGPDKRVGPDMRLEPNFFAVAQQLQPGFRQRKSFFEGVLKDLETTEAELPGQIQKAKDDLEKSDLEEDAESTAESRDTYVQTVKEANPPKERETTEDYEARVKGFLEDDEKHKKLAKEAADAAVALKAAQDAIKALEDELAATTSEISVVRGRLSDIIVAERLSRRLTDMPTDNATRHQLSGLINTDAERAKESGVSTFGESAHRLAGMLKDVDTPGTLRKSGPSLRFVDQKVDDAFLYDWIRQPSHFRPSSRMPQFFGLWKHLESSPEQLEISKRFEPIEILGISTYLRTRSQKFEYLKPPEGITESTSEEMVSRGREQFETRGCLACHSHSGFPDAEAYRENDEIVQGPDLSNLGAKFAKERNPDGRRWLYSWIKEPTRYHARTVMPNLFLDPIEVEAADGTKTVSDPVADIVEFLLSDANTGDWEPAPGTLTAIDDTTAADLQELARLNLRDSMSERAAETRLTEGIPAEEGKSLKGAEIEMVMSADDLNWITSQSKERSISEDQARAELMQSKQLLYVGRKAIAKYGCYGCHDIPGFEDAKPIGTGLADWGRKDPSKLAFEHIMQYVGHGSHGSSAHEDHGLGGEHEHDDSFDQDDHDFYHHALAAGHRSGFAFQKLKEPRSYDYHRTENIKYSERLRMPQFPFTDADREAVLTFVLGLIADPPAQKFVYQPDERAKALIEGRQVLKKYNCGGCHMLKPEQWQLSSLPGQLGEPKPVATFPFMEQHPTEDQVEASKVVDRQGKQHVNVIGLPSIDAQGIPLMWDLDFDDDIFEGDTYNPHLVGSYVDFWKPAVINGESFTVGGSQILIPPSTVQNRYPTDGGMLAKYLVPRVVAIESEAGRASAKKGKEAWGWVPPPLYDQGNKTQADWLHDFLIDPYAIRPAVVLRMPRFNLSPEEATKIVNFFAARDSAEFPYQFDTRRSREHLESAESKFQALLKSDGVEDPPATRLDAAMRIVVDKNYCRTCHLVGDFNPGGDVKAQAPNLADVYRRLQPDYVRRWIARPNQILPYTGMPENIKFNPNDPHLGGVSQSLFPGTSIEQLDGLVDLLMNFDQFTAKQLPVTQLVKDAEAAAAAPAAESTESTDASDAVSESVDTTN